MIPVSTSPVPAVASDGGPPAADEHALAGRADQGVRALQEHDAAERARRRVERREPMGVDPGRLRRRAGAPARRSAASARSAPSRENGSSPNSASASTTAGQVDLLEQAPDEGPSSRRPRPRPGPERERPGALRRRPRTSSSGRFTASSTRVSRIGIDSAGDATVT